jgi:two-component system, OmpR family, KDP operon response regulator KdpE
MQASSAGLGDFALRHSRVEFRKVLAALPDTHRAGELAMELQGVGIMPTLAFAPGQVLASLDRDRFDLVVVHLDLATSNPVAFFRAIRGRTQAEVLGLGGDRQPRADLRAAGVGSRASDSLSPGLLAARIAQLVSRQPQVDVPSLLEWGPLELNLSRRSASWCGEPLELTPTQLRILGVLVEAHGAVVTSQDLSRLVWQTAIDDRGRVFAHIRRIRKRIERDPAHPCFLLTVRGEGFRLADALSE